MRTAVTVARVFVGVLFLLSGLVKANDPLGLSYKMEEFFEVWNASLAGSGFFAANALISLFDTLRHYALSLSLVIISLEIIAGIALLLGWKRKLVLYSLLVLILFFTFLTAYAYWSGKFKTCGCFGDCLPITPLFSFGKDVLLLVLIIFLIAFRRYIQPYWPPRTTLAVLIASVLFCIGFQWYVLKYLPLVDCLPFRKGANIPTAMKMPPNAVPDSFAMKFIYEKEGRRFEFAPAELPADLATYKFIDREQVLIRKGNAEPAIKGFTLNDAAGNNITDQVLSEKKAVLVFVLHFNSLNHWLSSFREIYAAAKAQNIPLFLVTPDAARGRILFNSAGLEEVAFLSCDNTAVRTAARTTPTIYLLENGNVAVKTSAYKTRRLLSKIEGQAN